VFGSSDDELACAGKLAQDLKAGIEKLQGPWDPPKE
jgi:hypothetical protein